MNFCASLAKLHKQASAKPAQITQLSSKRRRPRVTIARAPVTSRAKEGGSGVTLAAAPVVMESAYVGQEAPFAVMVQSSPLCVCRL